jgi:hypothetical protein
LIAHIKSGTKWILVFATAVLFAIGVLAVYTNVPTEVTAEDTKVFTELGLARPATQPSFVQEIALIRQVQGMVFKRAPLGEGIPEYEAREPADLMRFGQGLCFDRSRTFDKAFGYLGFESRHVYMLYREGKPFFGALLHYGQSSHAVTEVKTSRGWMFVDSNTQWVALTRQGTPVNADDVWRRYAEFDSAPAYLKPAWWAIRGMYSRKGQFYEPYLPFPFPELNWQDFLLWVLKG